VCGGWGKPPRGVSQRVKHPQRDTASWTQARAGSPRGAYPSKYSPQAGYYELDTGKGGKASEGRIPAGEVPPEGYC